MYPLSLIVEAKCYTKNPVGLEVVRNALGVLKDISENYFTLTARRVGALPTQRFNYASAIVSTSGFTTGAAEFAIAHQLFLIEYSHVPVFEPVINAIMSIDDSCVSGTGAAVVANARNAYRMALFGGDYPAELPPGVTAKGWDILSGAAKEACTRIRGSYFGMLQGRWPLHLLREEPLPPEAFQTDTIKCRVVSNERGDWRFEPYPDQQTNGRSFFALEFNLPRAVAELVARSSNDPFEFADVKQQHFSYIDLSGIIGGIRRTVRLELHEGWLHEYLQRRRSEI
ncbi:MAG: hypothetical protein IPG43_03180 [Proteobacteria bacterium]|nr:hypothetical protein [Pseudomonadota bacterium]